jgi:hypothetical protein
VVTAPSRVQAFGNISATGNTCGQTATVTVGNFLIAAAEGFDTVATTIADSKGNTWTQQTVSGGFAGFVVYTAPVSTGGSDTVTATNTHGTAMAISVLEVTGQSASPIDPASTAAHGNTAGTASSGATGTPASANGLAVGIVMDNSATLSGRSFSPSLSSQSDETIQGGSNGSIGISDGPLASAAAETFTATVSGDYHCWCLLIEGLPPLTPGFFASVGRPGPRVPANTFRQGGY